MMDRVMSRVQDHSHEVTAESARPESSWPSERSTPKRPAELVEPIEIVAIAWIINPLTIEWINGVKPRTNRSSQTVGIGIIRDEEWIACIPAPEYLVVGAYVLAPLEGHREHPALGVDLEGRHRLYWAIVVGRFAEDGLQSAGLLGLLGLLSSRLLEEFLLETLSIIFGRIRDLVLLHPQLILVQLIRVLNRVVDRNSPVSLLIIDKPELHNFSLIFGILVAYLVVELVDALSTESPVSGVLDLSTLAINALEPKLGIDQVGEDDGRLHRCELVDLQAQRIGHGCLELEIFGLHRAVSDIDYRGQRTNIWQIKRQDDIIVNKLHNLSS